VSGIGIFIDNAVGLEDPDSRIYGNGYIARTPISRRRWSRWRRCDAGSGSAAESMMTTAIGKSATLAWDALSPTGKVENLMKVADLAAYRAARDVVAIRLSRPRTMRMRDLSCNGPLRRAPSSSRRSPCISLRRRGGGFPGSGAGAGSRRSADPVAARRRADDGDPALPPPAARWIRTVARRIPIDDPAFATRRRMGRRRARASKSALPRAERLRFGIREQGPVRDPGRPARAPGRRATA
jgi:hypothetical protein